MKDIVVFLSNVADKIVLPSRRDTLNLLHFLLSFAPTPNPSTLQNLRFSFYKPILHRYYPPAIDGLAKLLLLDDPNRTYFKQVFSENSTSLAHPSQSSPTSPFPRSTPIHGQYDLLTRAFGLAIAILPDRTGLQLPDERLAHIREASLSQGLLAADILTGLLPSSGAALARSWLGSQDCWVPSLLNLCHTIFNDHNALAHEGWRAVMNRAFGMLRRLATIGLGKNEQDRHHGATKNVLQVDTPSSLRENGNHITDSSPMEFDGLADEEKRLRNGVDADEADERRKLWDGINADILPNWSAVVGALVMSDMDLGVLREMAALAALDE
jgi:SWI/SNF chromatin-remodeling complex subunit SWI1